MIVYLSYIHSTELDLYYSTELEISPFTVFDDKSTLYFTFIIYQMYQSICFM